MGRHRVENLSAICDIADEGGNARMSERLQIEIQDRVTPVE
jgi:hypothetical protein